jgi:hypothetical protein
MGAWGVNSFENDAALDWLADLEEAEDASLLIEAFQIDLGEPLDADAGVIALAAAEVVAVILGRPAAELPPSVEEWGATCRAADIRPLVPKALAAIEAVLDEESELRGLWEESEESFPDWQDSVEDLQSRLQGVTRLVSG